MRTAGTSLSAGVVVKIPGVLCKGELRHSVLAQLRNGGRHVIVDLARLRTIDAAGLGELVRVYNVAVAAHGKVRLVNVTPRVRRMLDLAGVLNLLTAEREYRPATSGLQRVCANHAFLTAPRDV